MMNDSNILLVADESMVRLRGVRSLRGEAQPREPRPPRLLRKGLNWARAEASLALQGPVPLPVYEERMAHCMACPKRTVRNGDSYCGPCGCGMRGRAKLTKKLTMPLVSCPLGKWGEAVGVRHISE